MIDIFFSGMQCNDSIFVISGNLCSEMPSWVGRGGITRSESLSPSPLPFTELVLTSLCHCNFAAALCFSSKFNRCVEEGKQKQKTEKNK